MSVIRHKDSIPKKYRICPECGGVLWPKHPHPDCSKTKATQEAKNASKT